MKSPQNHPCNPSDPVLEIDTKSSSLKFEWLDSNETAFYLKISPKTLLNLTSNGKIPFYKFGRRNRYRKDELNQILLQNKRGQNGN